MPSHQNLTHRTPDNIIIIIIDPMQHLFESSPSSACRGYLVHKLHASRRVENGKCHHHTFCIIYKYPVY